MMWNAVVDRREAGEDVHPENDASAPSLRDDSVYSLIGLEANGDGDRQTGGLKTTFGDRDLLFFCFSWQILCQTLKKMNWN